MARTYTYDDFDKALRASGLMDQFSDADLKLAQRNPDAGMAILSYKQDYNNATTDELRALAHAGAEGVRSSFGEYMGGGSGDGYKVTQMSPGGFDYSTPAPVYKNTYGKQADDLLTEIMNHKEFSYDPATDPLYSSYKKTYTREGKRATADTLGEAAAMTGGIPSSYAVTAASQAGNYYASQLADKVPELYEMAYSKYLNDYNAKLDRLQMLQDREQFEHGKYLDEVDRYENDKNFDYVQWLDEVESQANERSEALSKAYAAAKYGDYSLLEALGITPDYALLAQLNGGKDTATSNPDSGTPGIDESLLATLKTKYPDGVVTDADTWKQFVDQYGEDALNAAGFTYGSGGGLDIPLTGRGLKFATRERLGYDPNLIPAGNADIVAEKMEKSVEKWLTNMFSGVSNINSLEAVRDAVLKEFPAYANSAVNKAMLDELIAEIAKERYGYIPPKEKLPEYRGTIAGMAGGDKTVRKLKD